MDNNEGTQGALFNLSKIYSSEGADKDAWLNILSDINQGNETVNQNIISFLQKALKEIPKNQLTLDILDFFVEYGTFNIINLIANSNFSQTLISLLKQSSNSGVDVQKKVIFLIQKWANKYKNDINSSFPTFIDNYNMLKNNNISFPPSNYKLNTYNKYISDEEFQCAQIRAKTLQKANFMRERNEQNKNEENTFTNPFSVEIGGNENNNVKNCNNNFPGESEYSMIKNYIVNTNPDRNKLRNSKKNCNINQNKSQFNGNFNENRSNNPYEENNNFINNNNFNNGFGQEEQPSNLPDFPFGDIKGSQITVQQNLKQFGNDKNNRLNNPNPFNQNNYNNFNHYSKNIPQRNEDNFPGFNSENFNNNRSDFNIQVKNPFESNNQNYQDQRNRSRTLNNNFNNNFNNRTNYNRMDNKNPFLNGNNNYNNNEYYYEINFNYEFNPYITKNNNFSNNYNNNKYKNYYNNNNVNYGRNNYNNSFSNSNYFDVLSFKNIWENKLLCLNQWIDQGKYSFNSGKLNNGMKEIINELPKVNNLMNNYQMNGKKGDYQVVRQIKMDMEQTCSRYENLMNDRKVDQFQSAFNGNTRIYYYNAEAMFKDSSNMNYIAYTGSQPSSNSEFVEKLESFGGTVKDGVFFVGGKIKEGCVSGFNFIKNKITDNDDDNNKF